jgi:uncharacterized protein with HEPN domain
MKDDKVYLRHILDEIHFLLKETEKLNFSKFIENEILIRAVSRSFEIIGEATKNLSKEFKKKNVEIEWKKIAGFRDKLIHYYFGINWDIVWSVIKDKLPTLKDQIEKLLKK